jgi:tetratricopeptide (TPR) repeat protein/tRNA A-37 threonylcarbamoyl transferase component Bud32
MADDTTPSTPPNGSLRSDNHTRSLPPNHSTPAAAPTSADAADLPSQVGRYRIEGEIARGGMGVVFRASDPDFGRTLAVKVLLDHRCGDEAAARRFLDEARLCGQLQHPGIPPVHEMGTLPDGRPFFAMKLVKGDTLAALLARRASPADDLPRFVGIFEQVCQTVAYAHSRGVIHRDLKPSNVMVGAFGEVQVMDWGLVRILTQPSDATATVAVESSTLYTARGADSGERTVPGSILGTPAFMPPEQARGQIDDLDEHVDVFALGATLCVILTGHAPYGGGARPALQQAKEGDLAEARRRLGQCGADEDLVRLTQSCLAFQPSERPGDAAAVAQAVAAYRAGVEARLRQAELARAQAEVRAAEERKRRRVLLGLALAVLLLMLTGGAAAWLWQQQHAAAEARRRQTDGETALVLERGRTLLADGLKARDLDKLGEAKAEADRAVDIAHSGGASAAVQEKAVAFQTEATEQADRARKEAKEREARAQRNRVLLRDLLDVAAPREVGAYTSDKRGVMAALAEPSVDEQYAAAFQRWGGLNLDGGSAADVAARLRQEPEAVVQEVLAALDNWMLYRRRQKQPEARWRRLFQVADALDRNPRSRQLRALVMEEALPPRPEAVVGLLGASPWPALWELTRGRSWRPLLELRGQVDAAREPVLALRLLARASEEVGDSAGAEALLRWATAARPEQVVLLDELGRLLERQGRAREAVECFRALRALRPGLGVALGKALVKAGRGPEGEAVLLDLLRRQPNNPELHFYLGNALSEQKKWEEAFAAYRKAIDLKPDFATAYTNLGNALQEQKKRDEAVAAYRKAIELKHDLANAYYNLGIALEDQKKLDEAVAAYREAIHHKPDYAVAYYNLGLVLSTQKKLEKAVAAWHKAIEHKPDYADAYYNLGVALSYQKKLDEAVAALRKAIELKPDYAKAYNNLGVALHDQKKWDEEVAAYRKAIHHKPDYAVAYYNLGLALKDQKKLDEAIGALQKADRLQADDPVIRDNLRQTQQLLALDRKLAACLTGKDRPDSPRQAAELAFFCAEYRERYRAAVRLYGDAFRDDPALLDDLQESGHRYFAACYASLAAAGQGGDAAVLADGERAALRRQAWTWLRADLDAWQRCLRDGNPRDSADAAAALRHWQANPDLGGVRHPWSLMRLPAEERRPWQALWADVAALAVRAPGG